MSKHYVQFLYHWKLRCRHWNSPSVTDSYRITRIHWSGERSTRSWLVFWFHLSRTYLHLLYRSSRSTTLWSLYDVIQPAKNSSVPVKYRKRGGKLGWDLLPKTWAYRCLQERLVVWYICSYIIVSLYTVFLLINAYKIQLLGARFMKDGVLLQIEKWDTKDKTDFLKKRGVTRHAMSVKIIMIIKYPSMAFSFKFFKIRLPSKAPRLIPLRNYAQKPRIYKIKGIIYVILHLSFALQSLDCEKKLKLISCLFCHIVFFI